MTANTPSRFVPKLRFPEFHITGDWRRDEIGNVASIFKGKGVAKADVAKNGSTPCIRYAELYTYYGEVIREVLSHTNVPPEDLVLSQTEDVIVPASGETRADIARAACVVPSGVALGGDLNILRSDLSGLFFSYLLNSPLRHTIARLAQGDTVAHLYPGQLSKVTITYPMAAEQQKIADCLGSLDDLIAAEGRKLEALRQHKQGLMQQLFPQPGETVPRLRFREFQNAGEWEEKKLDDLAKRGTGHTPNKATAEYYNGGIKWVSLADSRRLDNGLISETAIEISEEGIKNSSAVLHPAGSVILSRDAGVGKSAITSCSMAVSQHFIVWTCERTVLSNWFLYHQLQILKPLFERIAVGNTIKTIGLPFFRAMRITVPRLAEQQRIADCLSSLDARLAAQVQKLNALKTHKQGLLQQLFPFLEGQ